MCRRRLLNDDDGARDDVGRQVGVVDLVNTDVNAVERVDNHDVNHDAADYFNHDAEPDAGFGPSWFWPRSQRLRAHAQGE